MLSDAHFDHPLLNDAFDFSRYPIFKSRNSQPMIMRPRPRNVSESQLVSSTGNCMTESWSTNFTSTRTVGDLANLSSDGDICSAVYSGDSTVSVDTLGMRSSFDVDDDSRDTLEDDKPNDPKDEEDSLYSMDSADQDAHPLLLSMPIIPKIKLERKATVRKPDPEPLRDPMQSQTFLSPRIRDLGIPARISSRRYGRILARPSSEVVVSSIPLAKHDGHDAPTSQASPRFGSTIWSDRAERGTTELAYVHSVSEPILTSPSTPDGEKGTDESLHSDVLLSVIEQVGCSPGPRSDILIEGTIGLLRQKQDPHKHPTRSHQRSSVAHSLSFSSIVHAVADSYASLDLFLRKPKTKSRSTANATSQSYECVPGPPDPTSKWASKDGQIIIKVFVPSTDDIWMFRVPQDIGLADFTSKVAIKLGSAVSFSGSPWDEPRYYFTTDEQFKPWVKGRIRFGRNLPIVAHVIAPLPLVRLDVDGIGCEVWCYA